MSGFFDYELSNNTFIHKIQDVPQFSSIFKHYCLNNGCILLVPQSVNLDQQTINQTFLETHIIVQNPANKNQFVTINGARGEFSQNRESFHIIADPPADNANFNALADPQILFSQDSLFFVDPPKSSTTITALREGQITVKIEGKDSEFPLILISDPLSFAGVSPVTKQLSAPTKEYSNLYGLPIPSLPISISSLTSSIPSIPYIPSYLSSSPVKNDTNKQQPILQPTTQNNTNNSISSNNTSNINNTTNINNTNNSNNSNMTNMTSSQQKSFWNTMFGSVSSSQTDKPPLFPDSPSQSHTPPSSSITPSSSSTSSTSPSPNSPNMSNANHNNNNNNNNIQSTNSPRPTNANLLNLATQQSNMTSSRSYDSLVTLNPPSLSIASSSNSNSSSSLSSNSSSSSNSSNVSYTIGNPVTPTGNPETANNDNETQKRAQFLSKLKHPKAADLMKSLKNFIVQFRASSPASVEDQGQVVRLCLGDMEHDIENHPLWKEGSPLTDEDLDIIREALEKHVTTKLYHCTFPPARTAWNVIKNTPAGRSAIDPSTIALNEVPTESDVHLTKLIASLQFITPKHLDIHPTLAADAKLNLARTELKKINNYKTPRDKMVCILNCCKVIYNLLNSFNTSVRSGDVKQIKAAGADEFLPILIYVTLTSNPPMLDSNAQYIQHFRHPSKLIGEAGYYFTNLLSVISFFQILTPERLSIDPEEFERLKAEYAEKDEQRAADEGPQTITPRTAPVIRRPSVPSLSSSSSTPSTPLSSSPLSSSSSRVMPANLMDDPVPATNAINAGANAGNANAGNASVGAGNAGAGAENGYADSEELLRDAANTFQFMKYEADDLKISQISHLLDEYKKLALENLQLKKTLQQSKPIAPKTPTKTNNNNNNNNNNYQNGTTVIPPPAIMLTPSVNDQNSLLG